MVILPLLFCRCAHRAGRSDADSVHHRKDGGRSRLWGDLHLHGRALPHRGPQRGHGDQFLYRQVWGDGRAVHSLHGTCGGEMDRGRGGGECDVIDIYENELHVITMSIVFF